MLQFKNIEARKDDTVIFPSINLLIQANKITAIHSNVTIREQLIKLISQERNDCTGKLYMNDQLVTNKHHGMIHLFRLEENLYDRLTVKEMVQFMIRMTNSSYSLSFLIKKLQLEMNVNVKISQLTFSEKKRLQLAIILLFPGPVYFFEEPDHNIDIESRKIFIHVLHELKEKNKAVCILTANMESAIHFADIIYRLSESGLHEVTMEDENESVDAIVPSPTSTHPIRLEKIPTKIEDKIVLFDPLEIDYIESYEGNAYLYINGDSYPTTTTLQALEKKLIPFGFFRCHRSYIINLQKVREVITWTRNSYSLTLDDKGKTTIPLSKAKLQALKEMLGL